MKLQQAVEQYVSHKRSLGMQCQTMARQLRAFCKASGDVNVDEVGAENGTRVHLRQWPSHFQFAWEVSCLTWFLSLPLKPRLHYELTAPSSDPKGTGAFDTLHLFARRTALPVASGAERVALVQV